MTISTRYMDQKPFQKPHIMSYYNLNKVCYICIYIYLICIYTWTIKPFKSLRGFSAICLCLAVPPPEGRTRDEHTGPSRAEACGRPDAAKRVMPKGSTWVSDRCTDTHIYTNVYVYTCVYMYMCVHIYIYMNIYA